MRHREEPTITIAVCKDVTRKLDHQKLRSINQQDIEILASMAGSEPVKRPLDQRGLGEFFAERKQGHERNE